MAKLDDDLREALMDSCLDESTKVIRYLKEQERKQKKDNTIMLIITLVGALGSIIAAITGLLLFFQ